MARANLIDTINELGNALAASRWPVVKTIVGKDIKTSDIYNRFMGCYSEVDKMETDLHDCVNELCLKCGNYREEHLGACDGCRWKEVKHGFR